MQEQIVIKTIELNIIVVSVKVDIFSTNEKVCAIWFWKKICYINEKKVKIMARLCNCRICGIEILDEDICDICKKTNNKEKTI